jgi:hypothetical protein
LGAEASTAVRDELLNCPGASLLDDDLGFGAESYLIALPGTRSSPEPVLVAVVRAGDVVGMLTASQQAPDRVTTVVRTWFEAWTPVMTVDICPQQATTVIDATRNPSHPDYAGGWVRRETVTLDGARESSADIAGRILLRQAAGFDDAIPLPTAPLPDPAVAPLPDFPAELTVVLPADRPLRPEAPRYPQPPTTAVTEPIVAKDPVGPGCGWAFTGLTAPDAVEQTPPRTAAQKRIAAVAELVEARAAWWVARYEYAVAHRQFVADAKAWNAWQAQATTTIATAWWKAYDDAYRSYLEASVTYIADFADWEGCSRDCGPAPTSPVPPEQPKLPRP